MSLHESLVGAPIPRNIHATSVSLPSWESVVGYEEGDQEILSLLCTGYPRFRIHSYHDILANVLIDELGEAGLKLGCFIFPSIEVAKRCVSFITFENNVNDDVFVKEVLSTGLFAVFMPFNFKPKAKLYWQHSGEITSSRQLSKALLAYNITPPSFKVKNGSDYEEISVSNNHDNSKPYDELLQSIRNRISKSLNLHEIDDNTITITVSGMSAIFNTLRLVQLYQSSGMIVVFGFPYLDTLKVMMREEFNKEGCIFLGFGGEEDLDRLANLLADPNIKISAIFTEFPSNPLLKSPDLERLTQLAEEYNFLVVVDDTIGSFGNIDLLTRKGKADVICTSLTKVFSGVGDVLAGSIVINPYSKHFNELKNILSTNELSIPQLDIDDLITLDKNSENYIHRLKKTNENALELAKRLKADHRIQNVYYPGASSSDSTPDPIYTSYLRDNSCGYGCLLSFVLSDNKYLKDFYNKLEINKGPSLGTEFTLVCPYTLLAHYNELEWAESYGVSRNILRVSVGEENIEQIWTNFKKALDIIQ